MQTLVKQCPFSRGWVMLSHPHGYYGHLRLLAGQTGIFGHWPYIPPLEVPLPAQPGLPCSFANLGSVPPLITTIVSTVAYSRFFPVDGRLFHVEAGSPIDDCVFGATSGSLALRPTSGLDLTAFSGSLSLRVTPGQCPMTSR